jgi:hypothetical protein
MLNLNLVDDEIGKINRYQIWILQVIAWADLHRITLNQAISILGENASTHNITMKELLAWCEADDFIIQYKQKHYKELEDVSK